VRPDPRRAGHARREGRRDAHARLGPRLQVERGPADRDLVAQGRNGVPLARAVGRLRPRGPGSGAREGAADRQRVRRRTDPLPPPRSAARRPHEGPRSCRAPRRGSARGEAGRRVGEGVQGRARRDHAQPRSREEGGRGVREEARLARVPLGLFCRGAPGGGRGPPRGPGDEPLPRRPRWRAPARETCG
jgi:hypothetical protein